jgi:hypothetical protein
MCKCIPLPPLHSPRSPRSKGCLALVCPPLRLYLPFVVLLFVALANTRFHPTLTSRLRRPIWPGKFDSNSQQDSRSVFTSFIVIRVLSACFCARFHVRPFAFLFGESPPHAPLRISNGAGGQSVVVSASPLITTMAGTGSNITLRQKVLSAEQIKALASEA